MKPVPSSPIASVPTLVPEERKPADGSAGKGAEATDAAVSVREIGGRRDGTEPTRFGDWEKNGRCIDF